MPGLFDISSGRRQIEVDFAQWIPDHPAFNNPGFPDLRNAFPGDLGIYRPVPGPTTFGTNTLKDLVPGVTVSVGEIAGFKDPEDNTAYYFTMARDQAADSLHLFRFEEVVNTWIDVTPASPPTAAFDSYARFEAFGNKVYVALGTSAAIHTKEIGTAADFAPVTDAPRVGDIIITRGFLVGIDENVSGGDREATRVTWSAQGDPENWIDPIADPIGALSVLRGFAELEGGGRLRRIVPGVGGADAIILADRKIWRMTFIGPPSVWDFRIIAENEGTSLPASVVATDDFIYFYGRRGWMRTDGARVAPIGAGKVNRAFARSDVLDGAFRFDPTTQSGLSRGIRAAVGAEPFDDRLVIWTYRSEGEDTFANLVTDTGDTLVTDQGDVIQATIRSDSNDTLLAFNEVTGAWGNAKLGLQAIGRVESNRTLADIPEFLGLNDDLSLVRFKSSNLEARFDTAEATGPVNSRVTVRHVWPFTDAPDCQVSLLAREFLTADVVPSTPLVQEADAAVPVNESGRYLALRAELPAGSSWTYMLGVSVELADQGAGAV